MVKKIIPFNLAIKSTAPVRSFDHAKVYTNDLNSVEIQFKVIDCTTEELETATATTQLYMRDGSFFQNPTTDVTRVGNVFSYTLKENEGNHAGLAKIQLVVIIGGAELASPLLEFEIISGLETKVAAEVIIQDWTTLTRDAQVYLDQMAEKHAIADADHATAVADHTTVQGYNTRLTTAEVDISTHKASTENPHNVTKEQVGLGNVDNTSDANKPVSTAMQTALNAKANKVQEDWITPTLINGWTPSDDQMFAPIQYKKDNFGFVHLRGGIQNGVDRIICTLPVGYRPKGRVPIIAKRQWAHTFVEWLSLSENGNLSIANASMPTDTRLFFYAIFLAEK